MTRRLSIGFAAIGVLIGAGCAEVSVADVTPSQSTELEGLRFEISLDSAVIPVGESGTVTIRLHNETAEAMQLSFASTCQILPYVENEAGAVLHPGGGAWTCGAALTSLDIPARGSVTRTLVLHGIPAGGAAPLGGAALEPGRYRSYALINFMARTQRSPGLRQLRSPTLEFEIR